MLPSGVGLTCHSDSAFCQITLVPVVIKAASACHSQPNRPLCFVSGCLFFVFSSFFSSKYFSFLGQSPCNFAISSEMGALRRYVSQNWEGPLPKNGGRTTFFFKFQHKIFERPQLISMKFCQMIGNGHNFKTWVPKFGGFHKKNSGAKKLASFR